MARDPVGRSFAVLRWIAEQPGEYHGVRQISAALAMQPSTVSRLLSQMSALGVVRKDPSTSRYALGLELMRLGDLASKKLDIRTIARPHLHGLADASKESVFLGVYDPDRKQMMRVDTVPSPYPLRYVVETNCWTEIYRGASGLAILAFLPPEEAESVLAEADLEADREHPWLAPDAMLAHLQQIRRDGFASTHGRRIAGAVGIAAPIFGAHGKVLGDVILTIPETRMESRDKDELIRAVLSAATSITADLNGYTPPAPASRRLPAQAEAVRNDAR